MQIVTLISIVQSYWKELLGFVLLSALMLVVNIQEEVQDGQGSDTSLCGSSISKNEEC